MWPGSSKMSPIESNTSDILTGEPLTGSTSRSLEDHRADRLVKVTLATGSPATFAFDALGPRHLPPRQRSAAGRRPDWGQPTAGSVLKADM